MDKHYLTPLELIEIANQHAYCAHYLLQDNAELSVRGKGLFDTLNPFISAMYMAFELNLKAYFLHQDYKNNQHRNLLELLEIENTLNLSNDDVRLLKNLARTAAFRKGVNYALWEDRSQFQVFCVEIFQLYQRFQDLMPLELHPDYQSRIKS